MEFNFNSKTKLKIINVSNNYFPNKFCSCTGNSINYILLGNVNKN